MCRYMIYHTKVVMFYHTCGGILRSFKLKYLVTSINFTTRKKPVLQYNYVTLYLLLSKIFTISERIMTKIARKYFTCCKILPRCMLKQLQYCISLRTKRQKFLKVNRFFQRFKYFHQQKSSLLLIIMMKFVIALYLQMMQRIKISPL